MKIYNENLCKISNYKYFCCLEPCNSENVASEKAQSMDNNKRRRKQTNKDKIPEKLIENRKQEIIASLEEIKDLEKTVISGIPRVYTGSKRGSNFRGVSVNGKKWQVSTSLHVHYCIMFTICNLTYFLNRWW